MVSSGMSDERSSCIPSPEMLLMQSTGKPRAHLSASRRNRPVSFTKSALVSAIIGVALLSQIRVRYRSRRLLNHHCNSTREPW